MLKYSLIRFATVLLTLAYSLGSCGGSDPPTGPVDPPVTGLVVILTNPTSGGTIGDSITLEATTTNEQMTSRIVFYLNGSLITGAVDSIAPYNFLWTAAGIASEQRLTFSARAVDTSGVLASRDSAIVTYIWSSQSSITYPPSGAVVGDTMTVLSNYSGSKPITKMILLNNGSPLLGMIDSVAPFSFFLDSIPADTGAALSLTVQAIDSNGNYSESDSIIVHNRWLLLGSDNDDAWPRDIRYIWSRSTNSTIEFRVETYDPWTLFGSDTGGVDIVFYLDMDQNNLTGDRSTTIGGNILNIGDIGADYRAIVGNHGNVLDRFISFGGGQWTQVHDGTGFAGGDLSDSSNVMELDIFLNRIGNPSTQIDVVIGNAYLPGNVIDWAPDNGHITVDLTRPVLFVP